MKSEKKNFIKNWSWKDSEGTVLPRLPSHANCFYSSLLCEYQTVCRSLVQVFVPLLDLSRHQKSLLKI